MLRHVMLLLPLLLLLLQGSSCAGEGEQLRGHLSAFGQQGPSVGIDQVDGFLPPAEFFANYVAKNRPLLFKAAAKQSPAFRLWTDEYFVEKTPPRPLGDVFIEHNKKENRSQAYNYTHFKDFLAVYNTSNIYMVSDVPPFLLQDLVLPLPLQCRSFMRGGLDLHVIWFSSGGTSSVIHHDTYENINCLYRGRKTLVFVNSTKYKEAVDKIIDKNDGGYSSADVDKIDLEKRPEFANLEFYVGEMETGDCLYIPNMWLHQVRSFDNNLAVNVWWPHSETPQPSGCAEKLNPGITFDKVMFRSIQEAILQDAEKIRDIVATNMKAESKETFEQFAEMLSSGNQQLLEDNSEFAAAVKSLFEALDLDNNGRLDREDFDPKLKRRQYEGIRKAADNYNVAVYAIRQGGQASGSLPLLFRTSISDSSVFQPGATWPLSAEQAAKEEADSEYDKSLEDLDMAPQSGDDSAARDEL